MSSPIFSSCAARVTERREESTHHWSSVMSRTIKKATRFWMAIQYRERPDWFPETGPRWWTDHGSCSCCGKHAIRDPKPSHIRADLDFQEQLDEAS